MSRSSYYIYYRVAPGAAQALEPLVRRLLEAVAQRTGARTRLLGKVGEPELWMEIYEDVGDAAAFEEALRGAERALGIAAYLAPGSGRHVERFSELPDAASGPC